MKILFLAIALSLAISATALAVDPAPKQAEQETVKKASDQQQAATAPSQPESARDKEFERELGAEEYPTDQRGSSLREYWDANKNQSPASGRTTVPENGRERAVSADDYQPQAPDSPGVDTANADATSAIDGVTKPEAKEPNLSRCKRTENSKVATRCADKKP
jgi:hypothetical protein